MEIVVKGRHMTVTDPLREYAVEKIGKAARVFDTNTITAEVELYHEKNPSIEKNQIAEVTIYTKGPVIRAKEAATDMHAAIDLVSEKLETQVRKYKGKIKDRHSSKAAQPPVPAPEFPSDEEEEGPTIVKTKTLQVKPMTDEEAILQMELLGPRLLRVRLLGDRSRQRSVSPPRRRLRPDRAESLVAPEGWRRARPASSRCRGSRSSRRRWRCRAVDTTSWPNLEYRARVVCD